MPKLTFQWNSLLKLILGAEVHMLVSKLFRAEVTRAEHRLPHIENLSACVSVKDPYERRLREEKNFELDTCHADRVVGY